MFNDDYLVLLVHTRITMTTSPASLKEQKTAGLKRLAIGMLFGDPNNRSGIKFPFTNDQHQNSLGKVTLST